MEVAPPRFEAIAPEEPDLTALAHASQRILRELRGASDKDRVRSVLATWDDLRQGVESYEAMVDVRFSQDTRDPLAKAAREAWDEASPRGTELQVEVKRELLAHPLRAELEQEIGTQAFALWEAETLAFDPALKEDLAREAALASQYTELTGGARIEFQGQTLNLSTIGKYRQSEERAVRRAAEGKLWEWFQTNGERLDEIYDGLVKLRHGMARKLKLDDYVNLGYKRMCRIDYGEADTERFRRSIREDIVPLASELSARQARDLGLETLMVWDEQVHDPRGNPKPLGDRAWMVERGHEMFSELGGGLDEFDFVYRLKKGGKR